MAGRTRGGARFQHRRCRLDRGRQRVVDAPPAPQGPARARATLTVVLLAELRVLDLCDGDADGVTRLFADLGADVLKIEPPGGSAARSQPPSVAGASVPFALNNAN